MSKTRFWRGNGGSREEKILFLKNDFFKEYTLLKKYILKLSNNNKLINNNKIIVIG